MKQLRRPVCLLLAAAVLISSAAFGHPAAAVAASQQKGVLLLYDSEARSTPREGNIETLTRLLASFGRIVTVESTEDYRAGEMSAYDRVLFVRNAPDLAPGDASFITDLGSYNKSYLQIGGSDVPIRVLNRLGLQIRAATPDILQLSADGYSQTFPAVRGSDSVVIDSAEGQVYGRFVSESTGETSSYAVSDGTAAYASGLESGTLKEIALAELLKDWLKVRGDPATYVLIKEIYPFSDLDLLKEMADKLYDAGIPFLMAVKPVFYNTDYPAMKRYLQALAYAQSRNGSIVVDAPAVTVTSTGDDPSLDEKITGFLNLLADSDIVPVATNTPMFLAYDKVYSTKGMKYFDSVFLEPNNPGIGVAPSSLPSFTSAPFAIPFEQLQQYIPENGPVRKPMPMPTALTFDFFQDEAHLNDAVAALSESWIPFADYKASPHAVRTGEREARTEGGILQVNGTSIDLNKAAAKVDDDYVYIPQSYVSFKKLFNMQNRVLVVVTLFVLGIFSLFLLVGYRRYKRKFLQFGGRHDSL